MISSAERPPAVETPRLHVVTNDRVLRDPAFTPLAAELLTEGGDRLALHLRGHGLTGREVWRTAEACAPTAAAAGAWLIVNDRVDVAIGCAARGVQLGRGSLTPEDARGILHASVAIGVSVHDPAAAVAAVGGGADFLLAGTLFRSASHPGGVPSGVAWLREVAALGRPVIGIGGIDASRVGETRAAGAYGVAVIGAVWNAPDPVGAMRELLMELER